MPRRSDDTSGVARMLRQLDLRLFLRPKGGTQMAVAELKRKLRNSPFASLGTRIQGA